MNSKKICISILLLFQISLIAQIATAQTYSMGVKADEEIIWVVNQYNMEKFNELLKDIDNTSKEETYKSALGLGVEKEQQKCKWQITKVEEETLAGEEFFKISYKYWDWIDQGDRFEEQNDDEESAYYGKDPSLYKDIMSVSNAYSILKMIPTPTADYLKEMGYPDEAVIEGSSIQMHIQDAEYGFKYYINAEYNSQSGVLKKYQLFNENQDVIVELKTESFPIFILIIGIVLTLAAVGIVVIVLKRRKSSDPEVIIEKAQNKLQDPQTDLSELQLAELRGKIEIAKAEKKLKQIKKKKKEKDLDKGDKIMIKTEIEKAKANLKKVKDQVKNNIKRAKALMKEGEGTGLTDELKKSREKWNKSKITRKMDKKLDKELKAIEEEQQYEKVKGPRWKKIVGILLIILGGLVSAFLGIIVVGVFQRAAQPDAVILWERFIPFIIIWIIGLIVVGLGIILLISGRTRKVLISELENENIEVENLDEGMEDLVEMETNINKCPECGWILSSSAEECPKCDWSKAKESAKTEVSEQEEAQKVTPEELRKKKEKLDEQISELQQEIKELDQRFFNKLIEQEPYVEKKNTLYEQIGALQAKKEALEE